MAASLVVSGCSSGGSATPPPDYSSPAEVCPLLTSADLEAALGRQFDNGSDAGLSPALFGFPGFTKCWYVTRDPETPGPGVVIGVVHAYAPLVFDKGKRARQNSPSEPVAGVGDQAVWYPVGGELVVLAHDNLLGLSLLKDQSEPPSYLEERARRLALKALTRLR